MTGRGLYVIFLPAALFSHLSLTWAWCVFSGGFGVLLVRRDNGWSQKAFYTVEVPDLGLQLGSDRVEIVLLVNTHLGLTSFYSGSFTLGSDLRIARGPMTGDSSIGDLNGDVVAFTKLQSQKTYTNLPVHTKDQAQKTKELTCRI